MTGNKLWPDGAEEEPYASPLSSTISSPFHLRHIHTCWETTKVFETVEA